MRLSLLLLALAVATAGPALASEAETPHTPLSREQKVLVTNVTAASLIAVWGIRTWDYGQYEAHFTSEDWFDAETKHGGADKVGHYYVNFALTDIFAGWYESWGYARDRAASNAMLSAIALTGFMEWGDAYSYYGFSYQDFAMNVLGSVTAWFLYTRPALRDKFDLRVEYIPTGDTADVFTDYEGLKYLAALRASGFEQLRASPLRFFELHVGAYARGYETSNAVERRYAYVGLGVDLSYLLEQGGLHKTAKPFRYLQVPYTDVKAVNRLSR
jgi:hypothetical protein